MTLGIELVETFAEALVASAVILLLFRRSGLKFILIYCIAFPVFSTLIKAIELEWSIPPLKMSLFLSIPLALIILIAVALRRRRLE